MICVHILESSIELLSAISGGVVQSYLLAVKGSIVASSCYVASVMSTCLSPSGGCALHTSLLVPPPSVIPVVDWPHPFFTPVGFHCRCGNQFCGLHRYADQHNCPFDYKTAGREELQRKHPRVVAAKIQKL